MTLTDEELFSRFASGDEGAFAELMDRYKRPLFTVIQRMVHDMAEADDIFQETFLRVFSSADRFDPDKRFSSWVYSISANLCRDHLRRKKTRPVLVSDETATATSREGGPEQDSWSAEIGRAIELALMALSPEQREVFVLREYAGMSFNEISAATGDKLNTVLGRMHAAVKKLRAELAPFMEES